MTLVSLSPAHVGTRPGSEEFDLGLKLLRRTRFDVLNHPSGDTKYSAATLEHIPDISIVAEIIKEP
jgi:hypothetical protein